MSCNFRVEETVVTRRFDTWMLPLGETKRNLHTGLGASSPLSEPLTLGLEFFNHISLNKTKSWPNSDL